MVDRPIQHRVYLEYHGRTGIVEERTECQAPGRAISQVRVGPSAHRGAIVSDGRAVQIDRGKRRPRELLSHGRARPVHCLSRANVSFDPVHVVDYKAIATRSELAHSCKSPKSRGLL